MKPLLATIVNTPENPVPVEGTINGDVTVSGGVEVTNSPVMQAQQSGPWEVNVSDTTLATAPQPATASFFTEVLSGTDGHALITLPQAINASLVIVSFDGEKAVVRTKSNNQNILSVGSWRTEQFGDTVIPLPQPVCIDQVFLQCFGYEPACSVSISIIGDATE
jgi:hypothetical protein